MSKRNDMVPVSDGAYAEWQADLAVMNASEKWERFETLLDDSIKNYIEAAYFLRSLQEDDKEDITRVPVDVRTVMLKVAYGQLHPALVKRCRVKLMTARKLAGLVMSEQKDIVANGCRVKVLAADGSFRLRPVDELEPDVVRQVIDGDRLRDAEQQSAYLDRKIQKSKRSLAPTRFGNIEADVEAGRLIFLGKHRDQILLADVKAADRRLKQ